ncbi:hypothetical protein ACWDKQ_06540 [Saccharopolyspora sp. NPDC000995]
MNFAGPDQALGKFDEAALSRDTGVAAEAARQVGEYFARQRREFDLPIE